MDPELKQQAEAHLVDQAGGFGPKHLRILGRRVLEVIAPDVVEAAEGEALDREDREAARRTFLRYRRRGDGTTDYTGRLADHLFDRLKAYLEAYTPRRPSPPQPPEPSQPDQSGQSGQSGQSEEPGGSGEPASGPAPDDKRPYDERLGHAFGAFLEAVDPARLPLHGGDATTVIVTIDLKDLLARLGVALVGDEPISAAQARRLACTAQIIPAVLGGDSEVLDLGRARRLFSPAQRKAMALRDKTCRAEGCDIPAAWCEAHHAGVPWANGGGTDLADGMLLCSFHHHRAHDHHYDMTRLPNGDVRFRPEDVRATVLATGLAHGCGCEQGEKHRRRRRGAAPTQRRWTVYARSTTIRARPEAIDEGISFVRDEVVPLIQQIDGCVGISMLADRESGRCIATSAWETKEAMRASDEQLRSIRDRAGEIMGGSPEVEEWEIAVLHRDHSVPDGACARSTWLESDPADVDRGIDVFRMAVLPEAEDMAGFCSASLLVNRETGRVVATTTWDSRDAMEASREAVSTLRSKTAKDIGATIADVCEFEIVLAQLHAPEMA